MQKLLSICGVFLLSIAGFSALSQTRLTDRGLVGVPLDNHRVFLSWRLLVQDGSTNFQLQRAIARSGPFTTVHTTNGITAYYDNPGQGTYYYRVKAIGGELADQTSSVTSVATRATGRDYIELFSSNFARPFGFDNLGDTDGDGTLESMVRVLEGDTYKFQIWELGATLPRWTFDSRKGTTPKQAFRRASGILEDFDGDGAAEMIVSGKVGNDDTRFILVEDNFSEATVKHDWDWPEGWVNEEDHRQHLSYGNFGGKNPGLVAVQVQNFRNDLWEMAMWEWDGSRMVRKWLVTHKDTDNLRGSHQMIIADVDDDGKDEVVYGTVAIDHDGSILWDATLETFGSNSDGDGIIIADITGSNPGYEIAISEEAGNVLAILDDATGQVIQKINHPTEHLNWVTVADIDDDLSNGRGVLGTAGSHSLDGTDPTFYYEGGVTRRPWPFGSDIPFDGHNFNPIDWDGDQLLEMYMWGFDNNKDRNRDSELRAKVFGRQGALIKQINNPEDGTLTSSNRFAIDLFGDYREEMIAQMDDQSIRVYFNTDLPPRQVRTKLQNRDYLRMVNGNFNFQPYVYALGDFRLPDVRSSYVSDRKRRLQNKNTNEYLYEKSDGSVATAPLNSSDFRNGLRWAIEASNESGYVWIKNRLTSEYLRERESGAVVTEVLNPDYLSSKWQIEDAGDGYSWLRNRNTGEYLRETEDGDLVLEVLNKSWNSPKWKIETSDSEGYARMQNKNSKLYLRARDNGNTSTINPSQTTSVEKGEWKIEASNEGSYVWIKHQATGKYLRETQDGAIVTQSLNPNYNSSKWQIEDAGDGYTWLRNKNTGEYLREQGDGTLALTSLNRSWSSPKWKITNSGGSAARTDGRTKTADSLTVFSSTTTETHFLNYHPNPTHDQLNVHSSNNHLTTLSIRNLQGKVIFKQDFRKHKVIDVSRLPTGVYLMQAQQSQHIETSKLIIE